MRKIYLATAAAAAIVFTSLARADEKEITIDKVPQSLRAAIDQKVAGGKITEVSSEGEGDKAVYDIEFQKDGKTTEFSIDTAGKVKEEAAGGDHQDGGGELSKTPEAVQATAKNILGAHKCDGADKEIEDGKTVYEVSYKIGGTDYAVIVAEDGSIVAQEIEVDASVVPAKVAAAEKTAQPEGTVKEISIVSAAGKMFFEYDVKVGNDMHEIRVGPAGRVLSDTVAAPEATPASSTKEKD